MIAGVTSWGKTVVNTVCPLFVLRVKTFRGNYESKLSLQIVYIIDDGVKNVYMLCNRRQSIFSQRNDQFIEETNSLIAINTNILQGDNNDSATVWNPYISNHTECFHRNTGIFLSHYFYIRTSLMEPA